MEKYAVSFDDDVEAAAIVIQKEAGMPQVQAREQASREAALRTQVTQTTYKR